jgi:signal transduction histidine kinase/DNA-binding response OmpR family regulator
VIKLWLCAIAVFGLMGSPATASDSELGRPHIDVWTTSDFGGGPDTHSILPQADGRIVMANRLGLVVFDGVRWRLYPHPLGNSQLKRVVQTPRGEFCGGFPGEIGCFVPTPEGGFAWRSLNARLAPEQRNFNMVFEATYDARRRGVWFASRSQMLFVPDAPDTPVLRVSAQGNGWKTDGNTFVLYISDQGIFKLSETDPPQLEQLASIADVEGKILVGVQRHKNGSLTTLQLGGRASLIQNGRTIPIWVDQEASRRAEFPSALLPISGGRYVLGSQRGALKVLGAEGNVLRTWGREAGLRVGGVLALAEDHEGGIWVAQTNTIARIDQASATTFFGPEFDDAQASSITRWRGRVFITSRFRMLVLNTKIQPAQFEIFAPSAAKQIGLVVERNGALFGSGESFFSFPSMDQSPVRLGAVGLMSASTRFSNRMYMMSMGALHQYSQTESGLQTETLPAPSHSIASINDYKDSLWFTKQNGQLSRTRHAQGTWTKPEFVTDPGLPQGQYFLHAGPKTLWAGTREGVYRLGDDGNRFEPATDLPVEMRRGIVEALYEDSQGHLWMCSRDHLGVAWREGDRWRWDVKPLAALDPKVLVLHFAREQDVLWVMRANGLARIDLAKQREDLPLSTPLLSSVLDLKTQKMLPLNRAFDASNANLLVEFALPAMQRSNGNLVRHRWRGQNVSFTPWSRRHEASVSNLDFGNYVLEVEARDALGRVSKAELLHLRVPVPWYHTTAAKISYGLLALLTLWLTAKLSASRRQRSLIAKQKELEATVSARTHELAEKNEKLADQAERLSEVDRLKTRFFINVGHEFRTPLTLVLGPIDDLLRDTRERLSVPVRGKLELMQRNAKRVLDLIVELLDVNRFEQGQLKLHRQREDLRELCGRVLQDAAALAERYGHELRFEVPEQAVYSDVDAMQIERALGNLLSNAAKYSARGSAIRLTLERVDAWIELTVHDQGRGIAAQALPHVFDRFFQAEDRDTASGYGIGLSLVREIIEAHGGEVSVKSELGVGSQFCLRLMALEGHQRAEVAVESRSAVIASEASSALRPRLLIVEDHDDMRARLVELLSARFEVLEAPDGNEAWRIARDELPDLLVSDVMMPGCDGVELTRRLRAHAETQSVAILLLTAKVGSEHAVAALAAGANDYLAKPFDASELIARCEALLAHAKRLQIRLASAAIAVPSSPALSEDARWRDKLDAVIKANLHDPEFSVELLAEAVHVDRTQLFRRCKELLGLSPSEYLRDARLAFGHQLLEQAIGNISEAAYASGFESLSSFTRAFKTRYGYPPSQVRKAS